jgi:hypothetical protein
MKMGKLDLYHLKNQSLKNSIQKFSFRNLASKDCFDVAFYHFHEIDVN